MSQRRWPRELLALGALSAVLTLGAGGSAVLALRETVRTGHELAQYSRALRWHQDADMAHDALHADVTRARELGGRASEADKAQLQSQTDEDAATMRGDLEKLRTSDVPPRVRPELE